MGCREVRIGLVLGKGGYEGLRGRWALLPTEGEGSRKGQGCMGEHQ